MANQAIALQARAPQGNFLAPAIQQGAQFINMMSQQRAAERQAAAQQQQLEIARAKEERDITQAQIDNNGKKIDFYTKRAGQTMNAAGYELLLRDMDKDAPEVAAAFRANLPLERFDRNELLKMVGSVSDNFRATYGPLETQVVQKDDGTFMVTRTGGFDKPGAFEIPEYKLAPSGAAPTPAPGAPATTPTAPAVPAPAAGGMFRPAAFSPDQGADPQAALLASLNEAKQTGQISADVVEQLRQLGGPQAAPRVDAFLAQNNIKVAPGGMQSAVYRPEGGAPMAQQVQFDPNAYVATGQAARGRLPAGRESVAEAAAKARSSRETPEEVYAKELAKVKAARDVGPKPLTAVQEAKLRTNIAKDYKTAESTIDAMTNPVSGVLAAVKAVRDLTPDQKEAITGYSGYLPSVTGASKTADTKLKNLIGKVTALGKAQAALSGAIGPMAVQEWKIVRDLIADLEVTGMGAKDLDNQLDIIESAAQGAADRVRDTYLNQYAEEFERYPNRFQLKEPRAAEGTKKPLRFNPATGGFE